MERHLPVVDYVVADVRRRLPSHVRADELRSAGLLGLAQAAERFDATEGVPFASFATRRIRGAILDELRSRDWASRQVRRDARTLNGARDRVVASGAQPSTAAVAAEAGWTAERVRRTVDDVHRATVLHYDGLVEGDGSFTDLVPSAGAGPEGRLLQAENRGYLLDAVAALPDRLRKVVVDYFFGERLMAEIADELGVSESRVSQMRGEALVLIRAAFDAVDPDVRQRRPEGVRAKRVAVYAAEAARRSTVAARIAAGSDSRVSAA